MDLNSSLFDIINEPTIIFSNPDQISQFQDLNEIPSWDISQLNPRNRIESLNTKDSNWRIDGCARFGTQLYAVPTHTNSLKPLRIDVFIPSQNHHPRKLRDVFDSSYSVCICDGRIAKLGIGQHVARSLDYHSKRDPDFWKIYQNLPFGSKIIVEDIEADARNMRIDFLPGHNVEKKLLSLKSLQRIWDEIPNETWPTVIDISELHLQRQLHDSISLVQIPSLNTEDYIFKSSTTDPKYLYHELQILLKIPPHPNIISAPLYLVTKKSSFGGKKGVCGFILPYYPLGSLRDILPSRRAQGILSVTQQLKWCRQVTSALLHVRETIGTFYSDLRPDNVLLKPSEDGDGEDIVLVDFEQRGNWREWCAPEVLYPLYLDQIRSKISSIPQDSPWLDILHNHPPIVFEEPEKDNVGWNGKHTWLALSPREQESAEVFNLALFWYCVFEGLSSVQSSVLKAFPFEPKVEFPQLEGTPQEFRELIRRCTVDSPEWERCNGRETGGYGGLRRVKGKLYPASATKTESDLSNDIWESARKWWETELEMMQKFLKNKSSAQKRLTKRPTLREMFVALRDAEDAIYL